MKYATILLMLLTVITTSSCFSQVVTPPADTIDVDGKTFTRVEIEASFPGGDARWRMYLEKTVNPDIPMEKYAPPGYYTVMVQFIVDKDGSISDVKPLTHHGFGMEEEVVRVITKGPSWQPAMMKGKPVKAYRKQPVTFQVVREFQLSTYTLLAGRETEVDVLIENVKDEDLIVTASSGTVKLISGKKYLVKGNKPGRLLLTVSRKTKRDIVELDKVMLEVK
jgi:hypothetical protein